MNATPPTRTDRVGPPHDPSLRSYYCRGCGTEAAGCYVPRGWYSTRRHLGVGGNGAIRLGLFCSLACILAGLTKLARGTQPLDPPSA
jgi:hypothetical protein